jgi:hypothetical protein
MARLRNDTFVGSSIYDVDIDQLTFRRVVENAIGDTALVEDVLTGAHSPPADTLIDHRGDGRGCPLGAPLVNLLFARSPGDEPEAAFSDADSAYLFVVPFYLPRGEPDVDIAVGTDTAIDGAVAHVFDTTWTEVATAVLSFSAAERLMRASVALDAGALYVLAVEAKRGVSATQSITSLFVGFERMAAGGLLRAPASNPGEDVRVPVSGGAMSLTSMDENVVGDARAISSWHLTRLLANQNALEEHLTGAPAAGNAEFTLEASSAVAPSTSAFHDHSRSTDKPNEGLVDFPLGAWSFGGIGVDGDDVGFSAAWKAPALASGYSSVLAEVPVQCPTFDSATATVVIVMPWGTEFDVIVASAAFLTSAEGNLGTESAAVARMGTSDFAIAIIEGLDVANDAYNSLRLSLDTSDGIGGQVARVLGACAYFVGG